MDDIEKFKKKTLKIGGLQESSKSFKERKRAMFLKDQKKQAKHYQRDMERQNELSV
jgi:hypothetical protein